MKLIFMIVLIGSLQATERVFSQSVKINLSLDGASIEQLLDQIEEDTDYKFVYNSSVIPQKTIKIKFKNTSVADILAKALEETGLHWKELKNNVIVIAKATPQDPIRIGGIILDQDQNPLSGVSITIKSHGENKSLVQSNTTTDRYGHWSLVIPNDKVVIVFSFIGYKALEIPASSTSIGKIQMYPVTKFLDESMVMGYYTASKRSSTGATATITSAEISKQPVANPLNTLQGRLSGVLVNQSNGLPGSSVTIQVRGQNSLSNGTIPLYIVDGVPFNTTTQAVPVRDDLNAMGITGANQGISPFSVINPADIERIDVLKDGDATAIYGSRGANGVVIITTKKGIAGKTKIDLTAYTGIGKLPRYIDMLGTEDYLQLRRDAFANDGLVPSATSAPDLLIWDQQENTNWQKEYLDGSAAQSDIQLTISGGDNRTRFLINGGYHNETTVYPGNMGDRRFSGRFNLNHNSSNDRFSMSLSGSYAASQTNLIQADLSSLYNLPPNMPIYNTDGSLYWHANFTNPEAYLLRTYHGKTNNLLANASLKYTLLPGLDLKANLGFTRTGIDQNLQLPAAAENPMTTGDNLNNAQFADITQETLIAEPQLTYLRKLGQGKLDLLIGGSIQQSLNEGLAIRAFNYSNPAFMSSLAGAGTNPPVTYTPSYTQYRYLSVFGRANYAWQEKYIVNATLRRDGSSRFGPERRFGTFGSVGLAWIFSEESLLKDQLTWLSFGKLRLSYGTTGNDQFLDYQYMATLSSASGVYAYQGNSSLFPSRIENPLLAWETTRKIDFGLELGFLEDRIHVNANYYRNRSNNQLVTIRLAETSGTNSYTGNLPALIQNTGVELDLSTVNVSHTDFSWKSSLNLTMPDNKLLEMDPSYFNASTTQVGAALTAVMRYRFRGIDSQTGRPLYAALVDRQDLGATTLTPNFSLDRMVVGTSMPSLFGGLNNEFRYKNIDLSFFIQYTRREGNTAFASSIGGTSNVPTEALEGIWRSTNDTDALRPRASTTNTVYANFSNSDAVYGDASWLKLRNVYAAYTFSGNWMEKARLSNLRLFLQGQNLLVFSKQKNNYDPETGLSMPPLRIFTAGISCTF